MEKNESDGGIYFFIVTGTFARLLLTFTAMTYPYKTHYADLPGNCKVAYMDEGKGERTLLFIHGLANYAVVWKKNIDYLKQYYRCIAIDLPGNGLSDKNDHPYSLKFFASSVAEFINALKLDKVTLVGHSMGGQVAMTTIINYPGCAKSLVLCAPAGFEVFSAMDRSLYFNAIHLFDFITSDEQVLRHAIENSFYRNQSQGEGMIKELTGLMKTYKLNTYKKMVEACIHGMLEEPVYDKLGDIKVPVLVVFGKNDALIPNKIIHHTTTEQIATDAVKMLPNATLKILPDCGHFVMWEKADEVNREIIHFLERR